MVLQNFKNVGLSIFAAAVLAACGGGGGGGGLNAPSAGPVGDPPVAPSALSAVDTPNDNGGSISLTWTASGGAAVTDQRVYRGTTTGVFSLVALAQIADNTTTSYTDATAVDGTTYFYVVRSYDGVQESADSVEASAASANDGVPAAVSAVVATDVAADQGGSVSLSWSVSASTDVVEQRVYRGTASGIYGPTPVALFSDNTTTSYTDAGLVAGTTYYYGVVAYDGFSQSPIAEASVMALDNIAPAAPGAVTVQDTPSDQGSSLDLTWSVSTTTDVVAQRIYRGTASGSYGPTPVATFADNTTTAYTDTTVADGTTYYYVVRSVDSANESLDSVEGSGVSVDNTAPSATFSAPTGTTPVALNQVVAVDFSENVVGVDGTTLFVDGPGGAVTGTVAYAPGGPSATFTPADGAGGLSLNSAYSVTLDSAIADASGNPLPAGSLAFNTVEGAWGTAATIESATWHAEFPQVSIGANGNGVGVWQQYDGKASIFAARYLKNGGWQPEVALESNNLTDALAPTVAVAPNGNAVALWGQPQGTRQDAWSASYNATADSWSAPVLLETDDTGNALGMQVSLDASGNGVSTWYQNMGGSFKVQGSLYDGATATWSAPVTLSDVALSGNVQAPKVAVAANGDAVVVWTQSNGTGDNIWSNHYDATTATWSGAATIENNPLGIVLNPAVSVDGSGNALVVWQQWDTFRYNMFANNYDAASGLWGTPVGIETDNVGNAQFPALALDGLGNGVAVWEQFDGTVFNIWHNRYDGVTGTWGTAALVETNNAGDASGVRIVLDAAGNGMAVWLQSDGTLLDAMSSRYNGVTGFATPVALEAQNRPVQAVQVAVGPQGQALAVWHQFDGLRNDVRANRFE